MRLERGATHLHRCGPRTIAEFLIEVANAIGGMPVIITTMERYGRLDPATLRSIGADRFPSRQLVVVPS